jgi:hypothetical protein
MAIIRFLLVALLVFIAVTVAAFVYLEWWQALIVIIALIFTFVFAAKFIIRSFFSNIGKAMMAGFELKAKVLRGATAEVHSVEAIPVPPPAVIDQADGGSIDEIDDDDDDDDEDEDDEDDEEETRDLNYYRIDVTIRPGPQEGPMEHWDVSDLVVIDAKAKPMSFNLNDDDDSAPAGEGFHFRDVQVLQDGRLKPDEEGKYNGNQRINVVVGVPDGLRELKFRYYTEDFGRITLPPPYPRETQPQLPGSTV